MIRLLEGIEFEDYRVVDLEPGHGKLKIDLAANRSVDLAVVSAQLLRDFEKSEVVDGLPIRWFSNVRQIEADVDVPDPDKSYVLIWSPNEKGDATVALKVSPSA